MAGVGYSIAVAAQKSGVPQQIVEAAIKSGSIKVFTIDGTRCVNELGLAHLRGIALARAEHASREGKLGASVGAADPNDPRTWSDEEIAARGHALSAKLKTEGVATDQGGRALAASDVRFREGR